MSRPYRKVVSITLFALAATAAVVSPIANNHTDCRESGMVPLSVLALGTVALIGAFAVAEVRLRWAILAAVIYGLGVYVVDAVNAIGNCTA